MERYRFTSEQQKLLEGLRQPFAVYQFIDRKVVTIVLSDGLCKLFGYEDRAKACYDMDHDMYKDVHPDDTARIANAAMKFATEGGTYEVVYRIRRKNCADYTVVHATGEHVWTEEGVRLAQVWYTNEGSYREGGVHVGSELNQAFCNALHEESLLKASHYDYLTGLPSMSYFFELTELGREAMLKEGGKPVLLYIDLSGMKYYNYKHGFAEGDKLLRSFAKLLSSTFHNENCCHIGGDHFAVFTDEEGLADRLRDFFAQWSELHGSALPVRVGVYPDRMGSVPVSSACDFAKIACDDLKGSYASAFNYYRTELSEEAVRHQYILENLNRALSERWIQVYYQPIIRTVNGRVCDEEALARWMDPDRGLLPPCDFIPPLEEAGLIYKLDLYVLDRVLEKMKIEQSYGLTVVPHSINLSRSDFDNCNIVEEICVRVDAAGIGREKITIEITESTLASDFDFMKEQVERFQSLGFPVWMDDFGSGYSSLDLLQSIRFDLLKFDMSFMQKLDESDNSRIVLTELVKLASSLGMDTVCEGVETEEQARFLQEIGCSKLQGYYYCRPIPLERIVERYKTGTQIGFENPDESAYYDAIGRVNLYDLAVIASGDDTVLHNFFNTLPMGILELQDDQVRFVRSNPSYRDFMVRFFDLDIALTKGGFAKLPVDPNEGSGFMNKVKSCCKTGGRAFFGEQMPDGSVVHSFTRKISENPVTGAVSAVVAVLSITEAGEGTTYANIARALAADYRNLYYVDLETDDYIEYSSVVGDEELDLERHGKDFFNAVRRDTMTRVYEEDRPLLLAAFTKDNVLRELDRQGVFTMTYRLVDTGKPIYANLKIMRMRQDDSHLIIGVSIIDSQMKQKEQMESARKERDALARIMALTESYISLYSIDPDTGRYVEYTSTKEYESLGLAKEGEDFFCRAVEDAQLAVCPDDLPGFLEAFTMEKILAEIRTAGLFKLHYRLVIGGKPQPVTLKIAPFLEGRERRLLVGVRTWKDRK